MLRTILSVLLAIGFGSAAAGQSGPDQPPIRIASCTKLPSGHKRVGWGKYGLQFNVRKRDVRLKGGKPDVDYVKYIVQRKNSDSILALWFGNNAMSAEPDERMTRASSSHSMRTVVSEKGEIVGVDYQGSTADGRRWRKFVVGRQGAVYDSVPPTDSTLFDEIINSACETPYPTR
jgi:hypothetical protein